MAGSTGFYAFKPSADDSAFMWMDNAITQAVGGASTGAAAGGGNGNNWIAWGTASGSNDIWGGMNTIYPSVYLVGGEAYPVRIQW